MNVHFLLLGYQPNRGRLWWFGHHYVSSTHCKAWRTVGVHLIFDFLMKIHLIQPPGTKIYHASCVLDSLLGTSNITIKDILPALKKYPLTEEESFTCLVINASDVYVRFHRKKKLSHWKTVGKFLGQHILLVIKSVIKSGIWNPCNSCFGALFRKGECLQGPNI